MALINCPECNKEISDKASVCVHCGYPSERDMDDFSTEDDFYDRPREVLLQILKQLAEVNVNLQLIRGNGVWDSISDIYNIIDEDVNNKLDSIEDKLKDIETSIDFK